MCQTHLSRAAAIFAEVGLGTRLARYKMTDGCGYETNFCHVYKLTSSLTSTVYRVGYARLGAAPPAFVLYRDGQDSQTIYSYII